MSEKNLIRAIIIMLAILLYLLYCGTVGGEKKESITTITGVQEVDFEPPMTGMWKL